MRNGPYNLVVAPPDYPGKRYRGRYAYEHHVVFWQHTGRLPLPGHEIHHRNEDKRDNSFENLQEREGTDHRRHHGLIRGKPVRHGTLRGYRRGCRCESCRAEQNRYMREWKRQRRAALRSS